MNKEIKHKNIIIVEEAELKESAKNICICGRLGSVDCLFKACKKCCNTNCCSKHSLNSEEPIVKQCIFCKTNTNFHVLDNIYICKGCYLVNAKLIDNITQNTFMFEVENMDYCLCYMPTTNTCLFKSCRNCCPSNICPRHNKDASYIGLNCCSICSKVCNQTQMNSFNVKSINETVHYCKKCYSNNRLLINNLIYKNATTEQISKLKIKVIETEEEKDKRIGTDKFRETEEKENEIVKAELDKYKDKVITKKILNQLRKIPNFCSHELVLLNMKYQCPICDLIDDFEEMKQCVSCKKYICPTSCIEYKVKSCQNKNCISCRIARCSNNKTETYCKNCFVDDCKEFYNKYKNILLTSEMLENESIDLDEFSRKKYLVKYKCHLCNEKMLFDKELVSKCDRCDKYACDDCGYHKFISCGTINCNYCNEGICWNGENYFFCDNCVSEMGLLHNSDSDSDEEIVETKKRSSSPSELAESKVEECNICYVNKKKYACVPCGHLCMCGECSNKVSEKCPMCNVETTDIIKIFT